MPSPALVQFATLRNDGTITLATAPTVGNLMVLVTGGWAGSIAAYVPAGFLPAGSYTSDGNNGVQCWGRVVQSGDTGSYAISASDNQAAVLYEFSNADSISALAGGAMSSYFTGSAFSIPLSMTGIASDSIMLAAFEHDTTATWSVTAETGAIVDYQVTADGSNHTGAFVRINPATFDGTLAGSTSSGPTNPVYGQFVISKTATPASTKLHFANSLASIKRSDSTVVDDTTAGTFDSAYVSHSIKVPVGKKISSATFTPIGTYSLAADCGCTGTQNDAGGSNWITLYNSSGVAVFLFAYSSLGNIIARYWNGSGYTDSGSAFTAPWWSTGLARSLIGLEVVCGAAGGWALMVGGSAFASGSIASFACNNIAQCALGSQAGDTFWSQIRGATFDPSADRLLELPLSADSIANAGQAFGTYSDLEIPIDDSTAVSITTVGNKYGAKHSAVAVPGGFAISAVGVGARMRAAGTVSDGKLGVRSGTVNSSGSGLMLASGYLPKNAMFDLDPNTSAAWSSAALDVVEALVEAA